MTTPTSAPFGYTQSPMGSLPDPQQRYLTQQLQRIAASINSILDMTPQVATAAPKVAKDGMQRLARSPWRPAGGSVDAWVYYDQPSATWKLL